MFAFLKKFSFSNHSAWLLSDLTNRKCGILPWLPNIVTFHDQITKNITTADN